MNASMGKGTTVRCRHTSPELERRAHDALEDSFYQAQRTLFHGANYGLGEKTGDPVISSEDKFLRVVDLRPSARIAKEVLQQDATNGTGGIFPEQCR